MTLTYYRKNRDRLVSDTQLLLGDPEGERYDEDRIIEELQHAILEWALRTEQVIEVEPFGLFENHGEIDLKTRIQQDSTLRPFAILKRIQYVSDEDAAANRNPAGNPSLMSMDTLEIDLRGLSLGTVSSPYAFTIDLCSPGKFQVTPIPNEDGGDLSTPVYKGNLLVQWIGMPVQMAAGGEHPDSQIPSLYHPAFPPGAAGRILEEGDEKDLALADEYEAEFEAWIRKGIGDGHRGTTQYDDVRPL